MTPLMLILQQGKKCVIICEIRFNPAKSRTFDDNIVFEMRKKNTVVHCVEGSAGVEHHQHGACIAIHIIYVVCCVCYINNNEESFYFFFYN